MRKSKALFILGFAIATLPLNICWAWTERGHAIVCETAATLLSARPENKILLSHSFDFAYYCNSPDLVWKKPATYSREYTNHFIDLEIFNREFKNSTVVHPFELSRLEFEKTFPNIDVDAGRSFWRIREIEADLASLAEKLNKDAPKKEHLALQAEWLTHAGFIGHYIGDLSQPLHVTENHDGQLTDQKGIHAFYEGAVVDYLFHGAGSTKAGDFVKQISQKALSQWPAFHKKNAKAPTLELIQELADKSFKEIPALLKIDKKLGREKMKIVAEAYRPMIVDGIASSSLVLAEILSRHTKWNYDGDKFYNFIPEPEFVKVPQGAKVSSKK